ncbi:uncharacterized protein LOC134068940 isoform X2 [Sardina pilchardus]|uniref:uncharacterized protein LOC134068940 isoform X2 n=1 Tax=Sardina pilchardus TaxID=27697 RepID=UPI002E15BAD1
MDQPQKIPKDFLSKLGVNIVDSPASLNVIFGLILAGLERLADMEFECPCRPTWNVLCFVALFTIPAIIVFVVMMTIQICKCQCKCNCKCDWNCKTVNRILSSTVPVLVWLALLFNDGEYYACLMDTRNGTYVRTQEKRRWCQPTENMTVDEKEIIKHDAFKLYGDSQCLKKEKETKGSCCKQKCCREGTKNSVCCTEETKAAVSCGSRRVCYKDGTDDARVRCKREKQEEEGESDAYEITELNQP